MKTSSDCRSGELIQHGLSVAQVGRPKTFGKPSHDRVEGLLDHRPDRRHGHGNGMTPMLYSSSTLWELYGPATPKTGDVGYHSRLF